MKASELAEKLRLEPHPEGGFFREVYRSQDHIPAEALPERYPEKKSFCTSIYYLITADAFSAMHRLKSDEILHFYAGAPALVFMIFPDGTSRELELSNNISGGALPQIIVPGNVWFGIRVKGSGEYTLTGTTVTPGFDFDDFELAERKELTLAYPQHSQEIKQFTRH